MKVLLTPLYNPFRKGIITSLSTPNAEEGGVPIDQEVCMRGDSDITYLQQMTDPDRIVS